MQTVLPTPTLSEALSALVERTLQRARLGLRSPATATMQQGHATWLLAQLGDVALAALDAPRLELLLEEGLRAGLHPRTLQKRLSTLRQALALASRKGQLERLPLFPVFDMVAMGAPSHRWLDSWQDVDRLLEALPLDRAAWLALALYTGQRASDVERMTWSDVRLGEGEIKIRHTKSRRPDGLWVACPAPLLRMLRTRWRRQRPAAADPVVPPWPTRYYQLGRACLSLGMQPVTATGIRHTATSFAVGELGISFAVQKWFGWSSAAMMERVYAHALPGQLREVSKALSGPRRRCAAGRARARKRKGGGRAEQK